MTLQSQSHQVSVISHGEIPAARDPISQAMCVSETRIIGCTGSDITVTLVLFGLTLPFT
jgi:hypothetical protein